LLRGPQNREVGAGAAAELEQHAFGLDQLEDRLHRVLDRVDEARRALLGAAGHTEVEPDRAVERRVLGDQEEAQLLGPVLGVLVGGEVGALEAPFLQRLDYAVDELADAGLALWRAGAAPEVLLGDHIDGQLRPRAGDLDVLLLEDELALLAGDGRGAALPFDQVVGVAALGCEVAPEPESRLGGSVLVIPVLASGVGEVSCVFGHFLENASLNHPRCGFIQIGGWSDVSWLVELVRLGLEEAPWHTRQFYLSA